MLSLQQFEQYGKDYGLLGFKASTDTSSFAFSACDSNQHPTATIQSQESHLPLSQRVEMKSILYWPVTEAFRNSISMIVFIHLLKTELVMEKKLKTIYVLN